MIILISLICHLYKYMFRDIFGYMTTKIDEPIIVTLYSNYLTDKRYPKHIWWQGRQHQVSQVGLHYLQSIGRTLHHVYTVSTDGGIYLKLRLNTETLDWRLLEVADQTG